MAAISLCLWFNGRAREAALFYVGVFLDCGQPATLDPDAASRMAVPFTLGGQAFLALDGGPMYTFSPASSIIVTCADQAEVDRFWAPLSSEGKPKRCGWLEDKFGVSWQIVPACLADLMTDPDRAGRVMQALMAMTKLDIAALESA